MVVQWVVFAASQLQGPWFDPELGLRSVRSFTFSHVYMWVSFGFSSGFLPPPKNMPAGELVSLHCS